MKTSMILIYLQLCLVYMCPNNIWCSCVLLPLLETPAGQLGGKILTCPATIPAHLFNITYRVSNWETDSCLNIDSSPPHFAGEIAELDKTLINLINWSYWRTLLLPEWGKITFNVRNKLFQHWKLFAKFSVSRCTGGGDSIVSLERPPRSLWGQSWFLNEI